MDWLQLKREINEKGIIRCPEGFYLKGIPEGKAYKWQFYLRNVLLTTAGLQSVTDLLWKKFIEKYSKTHQFAAMESAAPIILAGLMSSHEIDGFVIRKNPKKYGLFNYTEGRIIPGKPVILLDDISNSKNTLMLSKAICQKLGLDVSHAITIVDKKGTGIDEKSLLTVESLFDVTDFDLKWNGTIMEAREFIKEYSSVLWVEQFSDGSSLISVNDVISGHRVVQTRTRSIFKKYALTY